MYLQGVADFLDDVLSGLALLGYGLVVGNLLWSAAVLDIGRAVPAIAPTVVRRAVWGLRAGAVLLAATTALGLLAKGWVLAAALGELPFAAYAGTAQFQARVVRLLLCLALIWTSRELVRKPLHGAGWRRAAVLVLALAVAGAWLVHAAGRLEARAELMVLTVLHQAAGAAWVGGVAQLLMLHRLGRRDAEARAFWSVALARFARLGIPAVAVLAATGPALAWNYVGSWAGLPGTAYGSLIVVKTVLMGAALGFALLNYRAVRRPTPSPNLARRVPGYVEAEALAGEAGRLAVVNKQPSWASAAWSDYNHSVCGLFLTLMAGLALLSHHSRLRWGRYWPLGFAGLGLFLFIRNDPQVWPLGPMGFWESTLGDGEVLQHRLFTLSTFVMGAVELRARTAGGGVLPYVFPVLCAVGGILLLTHGHAEFETKSEYLIKSTHTALGLLAAVMATGRWLELRLKCEGATWEGRLAGLASSLALLMAGMILMFYREPLS
jgi:putative copper resistance protein D